MNIKLIILSILLTITPIFAFSEISSYKLLKGRVIDNENNTPIMYATVYLPEYSSGTSTDEKGEFAIKIKDFSFARNTAKISCIGYTPEIISLTKNEELITVKLNRDVQDLKEVIVTKRKYKNRKNPAVELIEKVI